MVWKLRIRIIPNSSCLQPIQRQSVFAKSLSLPQKSSPGKIKHIAHSLRSLHRFYILLLCVSDFFPTVGWVVGTSNISEKQVPRGGNMIRGRLNVFLYFHTMYLQNCTLHIPIVLPHHIMCLQKNRDLIVLRLRGIWDLYLLILRF